MFPSSINHVMFNTGKNEQISVKGFKFPPYDRIALQWIIEQAKSPEGIDIDENVILKVSSDTYRYTATFAYGTYAANEVFLISTGARTKDAMNGLWGWLHRSISPKYHVSTPITHKPSGPFVVDILLPCSNPSASSYLHSSDCYDFCLKLGWALLYPESVRV